MGQDTAKFSLKKPAQFGFALLRIKRHVNNQLHLRIAAQCDPATYDNMAGQKAKKQSRAPRRLPDACTWHHASFDPQLSGSVTG
jgi:hypothetical protein